MVEKLWLANTGIDMTRYCMVLISKNIYDINQSTYIRITQNGFGLLGHLYVFHIFLKRLVYRKNKYIENAKDFPYKLLSQSFNIFLYKYATEVSQMFGTASQKHL